MEKKYELTDETKVVDGVILHRIRALKDFKCGIFEIKAGEIGGWIEKECNLSQFDGCWVFDNGMVFGNGRVSGNGRVFGNGSVSGNGWVSGNGRVKSKNDILTIGPIGSRDAYTSFYRIDNGGIGVSCGCFTVDIDEFSAKVIETHGESKHAVDYLAAVEFAKIKLGIEPKEDAHATD